MGLLNIQNPFKHESTTSYPNVLVPLSQAQRHSTVTAEYERRRSEDRRGSAGDLGKKESGSGRSEEGVFAGDAGGGDVDVGGEEADVRTTGSAGYSPFTLEGLRAEVNEDVAKSGHSNSAYDCECSPTPLMRSGNLMEE